LADRPDARARRLVAERADFRCEYCLTPEGLTPSPFSAEHVHPRSRGGTHRSENLAFSCQGCNGRKSARTVGTDPATRKTVPLFNPRRDEWQAHFGWTAEGTKIEGKSPAGRATVLAPRLNRPGLQNLRRLMVLADLHPPKA